MPGNEFHFKTKRCAVCFWGLFVFGSVGFFLSSHDWFELFIFGFEYLGVRWFYGTAENYEVMPAKRSENTIAVFSQQIEFSHLYTVQNWASLLQG